MLVTMRLTCSQWARFWCNKINSNVILRCAFNAKVISVEWKNFDVDTQVVRVISSAIQIRSFCVRGVMITHRTVVCVRVCMVVLSRDCSSCFQHSHSLTFPSVHSHSLSHYIYQTRVPFPFISHNLCPFLPVPVPMGLAWTTAVIE